MVGAPHPHRGRIACTAHQKLLKFSTRAWLLAPPGLFFGPSSTALAPHRPFSCASTSSPVPTSCLPHPSPPARKPPGPSVSTVRTVKYLIAMRTLIIPTRTCFSSTSLPSFRLPDPVTFCAYPAHATSSCEAFSQIQQALNIAHCGRSSGVEGGAGVPRR